jgi:plastocyanin
MIRIEWNKPFDSKVLLFKPSGAAKPMRDHIEHDDRNYGAAGAKTKTFPKLPANSIAIDNFSFEPRTLTVTPGTLVTWVNRDHVPHLIISPTSRFADSKVLDTGHQHAARFESPGEYLYFCSIHPTMLGKIIVK